VSVSYVIPTRDRGRLLLEAVASAYAASPDEVIVVDDGSTDGSVDAAVRAHPDLRVVRGPFGNAGRARNAGVAAATRDLIAFLDSDDVALPAKASVAARLSDPGLVLVHGMTEAIDEHGARIERMTGVHRGAFALAQRTGLDYAGLAEICAMFTSATMIRRDAFAEVGGYDESLDAYEDWDLYLRLSLVGQLVYDDALVARYRVWRGNTDWRRTARWTIAVAEKHLAALPALEARERERARFAFEARRVESFNVLGDGPNVREAWRRAARISPSRALRLWRPLLRSLITR
jgi:glycosyltransferase involved in cell wall biosynthesis